MKPYRFLDDLTSDVMFEATGRTLDELFQNAATALFSVICQIDRVGRSKKRKVTVNGESLEDLMFSWLQELILLVDTEEMFFSGFDVSVDDRKFSLNATCYGEDSDPAKGGTLVKALTYHKFSLEKTGDGYKVTVTVDI